ncbi:MAG: alpha/beta fold hydrolase [Cyanobacteria bacterium P01_E01_bin.6]
MFSTKPSDWIVRFHPNPKASVQLYCFPFAGGSANNYQIWSKLVPAEIEVCAIELPGRGRRMQEPLLKSLPLLVDAITSVLQTDCDRPFAFFGHSMGALISFELARCLRHHNQPLPTVLAISGRRPPQLLLNTPTIHQLPEPQFWSEIQALGGTPKVLIDNEELRQLFFPIIQADFTLIETYIYTWEKPLECPIAAYTGEGDPEVNVTQLEQWQLQTDKEFSVKTFPGDHFYINSCAEEVIQDLTPRILDSLNIDK